MPNFWVQVGASPPFKRRDELSAIAKRWGGKLRENQFYRHAHQAGVAYVLVKGPDDPKRSARMLECMKAGPGTIALLDVDEAQESYDLEPPPDGGDDDASEAEPASRSG